MIFQAESRCMYSVTVLHRAWSQANVKVNPLRVGKNQRNRFNFQGNVSCGDKIIFQRSNCSWLPFDAPNAILVTEITMHDDGDSLASVGSRIPYADEVPYTFVVCYLSSSKGIKARGCVGTHNGHCETGWYDELASIAVYSNEEFLKLRQCETEKHELELNTNLFHNSSSNIEPTVIIAHRSQRFHLFGTYRCGDAIMFLPAAPLENAHVDCTFASWAKSRRLYNSSDLFFKETIRLEFTRFPATMFLCFATIGSPFEVLNNTHVNVLAPCKAGNYQANVAFDCVPCMPGNFSFVESPTMCEYCPKGTYNDVIEASECMSCSPGKVARLHASTACTNCPAGSYVVNFGDAHLRNMFTPKCYSFQWMAFPFWLAFMFSSKLSSQQPFVWAFVQVIVGVFVHAYIHAIVETFVET